MIESQHESSQQRPLEQEHLGGVIQLLGEMRSNYGLQEDALRGQTISVPIETPLTDRYCAVNTHEGVFQELDAVISAGDGELFGVVRVNDIQNSENSSLILTRFSTDQKKRPQIIGAINTRDQEPLVVGRGIQEDLESGVSRQHFSVSIDGNGNLIVDDHNSTNGTSVITNTGQGTDSPMFEDFSKWSAKSTEAKAFVPQEVNDTTIPNPRIQTMEQERVVSETQLATEVAQYEIFLPDQQVEVNGREFGVSKRFEARRRDYAVLWSDIDGKVVPRLAYKSQSAGDWRIAYRIESNGRLGKESRKEGRFHYTQENKLHDDIAEVLDNQVGAFDDRDGGCANFLYGVFGGNNPASHEVDTAEDELFWSEEADRRLFGLREYISAGALSSEYTDVVRKEFGSVSKYFKSLDKVFKQNPGFIPDFSKEPQSIKTLEHPVLGEYTVESYGGILGKTEVVWTIGRDTEGRTWVDGIKPSDTTPSSYGTGNELIDSGVLTSKPIDYRDQATGLNTKEFADLPQNELYVDITPALSNLLPIKQYKKALKKKSRLQK